MATMLSKMVASPDAYTTDPGYKTFINSLAQYLRNDPATELVDIPAEEGYLYRFDLTQFLLLKGVALEDHFVIQVVNGIASVHNIDENIRSLYIPQPTLIAGLKQIYRTSLVAS